MRNKLTSVIVLVLLLAFAVALPGYTKSAVSDRKNLKLGCLAYSEPMLQWIKEGLAPLGYKVEIVMFDGNQLPATALKDGSIDGIIANHKPWIMTFNKQNNCNLEMVKPYHFYSFYAIYSIKHKKLSEIPQNSQIAVPGDPSNMSRSLIFLNKAGLMTLKEMTGPFYTVLDIKDNPRKIKIIETEITQTARSIQDVDAIISPAFYVAATGKVDPRDFILEDPQNKDFPIGLIVRSDDVNSVWAKEAVKTLRSQKYRARFDEQYKGKYVLFK
jgi:D-methionine transport system substrate-binding protein